ncbi:zinc ABC transporter substrate-binding protein [Microlunatus endophyticus]|uniref:Zinc ABC transporter substrate-binding protein n=2 Tax=Microlunatus endophyticus TaxID=1716077 RepID=A0A917S9T7_9ACTN|nr:zinc ABC transporter substrate-binding protein [Microlunatus endophyticus]
MKMVFMRRFPRALAGLIAVLAVLATSACATGAAAAGAKPGQLLIVTAFYPFQFVAQRIAGPHAHVTSLTKPGAEPHDLELTPRQVASIYDADLVIYQRYFQAAVDDAVAENGNAHGKDNLLDTADFVPLEDHGPLGEENDDPDDRAGTTNLDPHVWLDPSHMITITQAVDRRLDQIDPAHRADYNRNAAGLITQLKSLDAEYRTGLATCKRTEFITTHAAFGYLAERYGLQQISVTGLSPDTEPSPARIAQVQQLAKTHGVTTIFYETLISPAIARSIAGDLGLRTDVLDPIEGITSQSRGDNYIAVMKSNLTALQRANECS